MSILIKGIEMPKRMPIKAVIFPDGRVTVTLHSGKILERKAVPVPPHGDLIDRDALPWEKQSLMEADEGWALPCVLIEDAPTVIPSDKEEES